MTVNLATNKPQLSSKSTLQNTYLTQCKLCGAGVYQRQAWVWSSSPIGIVHTACQVSS